MCKVLNRDVASCIHPPAVQDILHGGLLSKGKSPYTPPIGFSHTLLPPVSISTAIRCDPNNRSVQYLLATVRSRAPWDLPSILVPTAARSMDSPAWPIGLGLG